MILDERFEFADAQALTASGVSTDHVDLGSDRSIGVGEPLTLVITLDAVPDAGSANETYVAALETDDNGAFSSPATLLTFTIPRGTAAGTRYIARLPQSGFERYLRIALALGGTTPSITYSAFVTAGDAPAVARHYPDGVT